MAEETRSTLGQSTREPTRIDEDDDRLALDDEGRDGPSRPGSEVATSESAARAGSKECAVESRGDEGLRKECERAVAEVSLGDLCALHSRLVDPRGRLTRARVPEADALHASLDHHPLADHVRF